MGWRMGGSEGDGGEGVTVVRSGLTMMGGGEVMAESGEGEAWVWAGPGSGPAVQLAKWPPAHFWDRLAYDFYIFCTHVPRL